MKTLYLYVLVSVAGAAVLAIEILGTRVLGPFYGVSLFLWSALITVTLAALSVGYAVGGRWADRGATCRRLCMLTAGAGIWLLGIPWLKYPVLTLTEPFGLRFAVLVAAFVLFAPPLTLLGMVSPYAIKLKTERLAEVGRIAGNLYALSTIASVGSALLTGFFLIPNVGVSRLILMIGVALLGISALGLVEQQKSSVKTATVLICVLISGFALWLTPTASAAPDQGLIAVEQSPYAEIRVLDTQDGRHLIIDGGVHTLVDPSSWSSSYPYVAAMDLTKNFYEKPGRLLLIGLGGGSIVKKFARDGWTVKVVEIDPVIIKVAHQHFGLDASEADIFQMDGRQFLTTHKERHDLIIMDAFGSASIPFHLVTRESFGLIAARLAPGGVLAVNIESVGWQDQIVRSLAATLKAQFEHVQALPLGEPPNKLGNLILLASNRPLEFPEKMLGRPRDYSSDATMRWYVLQVNHAWDNRFVPDLNTLILTDDLNPVDVWSERINRVARQNLHDYFSRNGLSW